MTWPSTFEERLVSWRYLRDQAATQDLATALLAINDWWWYAPMVAHTVSWQDRFDDWPNPWTLLAQNGHCDLARALGMLYTVAMCEFKDVTDIELSETVDTNLVRINKGKYILNWCPGEIVNIQSLQSVIKQSVAVQKLKKHIR